MSNEPSIWGSQDLREENALLQTRIMELTEAQAGLLAWADEMGCEMEGDDPRVCSPQHTGRCWPCTAKLLLHPDDYPMGPDHEAP